MISMKYIYGSFFFFDFLFFLKNLENMSNLLSPQNMKNNTTDFSTFHGIIAL